MIKKSLLVLAATVSFASPSFGADVISGQVFEFFGPDDLFLDPAYNLVAVDVHGDADRVVNGITFRTDGQGNNPGSATDNGVTVTTSSPQRINNWATAPAFTGADPTSATNLAQVMRDIRWSPAPGPLTTQITGLSPGSTYHLQLLFNEGADNNRFWDIGVNGELAVDNISSEGDINSGHVWTPNNSFGYRGKFVADGSGEINIVMQQDLGGNPPLPNDNNPILQAVIVSNPQPPEITVIDDGSATTLTDGVGPLVDFGCTMPGNPVTRTFTIRNESATDDLVLPSNGLTLPAGYSQNPGWPTALVTPEFLVKVKKENGAASAVDFASFELRTIPDILSITSITLRIPEEWIVIKMGNPDSQSPFFDGDTPFVIDPATTGLDIDEVNGVGSGWFCDPPGAQNNPNGDICVEFGGLMWNQGQQNRYTEATLRFTPGAFSGSLDTPNQNDDLTFGFGTVGLNNPRVPGSKNDGEAFWEAGLEVDVMLFNSMTGESELVSGTFVDDPGGPNNGIAEAILQATPVEVAIPVTIPPGQSWTDVVKNPDGSDQPLTVQLDALTEGTFSGDWSLENNDADENPFNFPITGIVDGTPPTIVDLPADIVEPAVGTTCEAMVTWTPPTVSDNIPVPPPTLEQTMGDPPGSIFAVGVHTIEYTATDCAGNVTVESFTVTVSDQDPPTLVGALPKRIIRNTAPGETSVIVEFGPFTAIDNCDPEPEVICTPESGSVFNLGLTEVCCFARDSSGNVSPTQCFDVIVIEAQPSPAQRDAEIVIQRNLLAPGVAGATILGVNHAFLNENGSVAIEGTMLGAELNNVAVWKDVGSGLQLVSQKGDSAPGVGLPISRYDDVILNDSGEMGFEIFVSGATATTDTSHVSDASGSLALSLREGGTPPGTIALFSQLHEPAFDGMGATVSPANLALGVGGVVPANDTGIWYNPSGGPLAQVLREGSAVGTAIPNATCGQVAPRIVANVDGHMAIYLFLAIGPGGVSANDNTAILSGLPGSLSVVAREGMPAPGPGGNEFQTFAAESISSVGRVAFEAGLKTGSGDPVTSANNEAIYTNSNGSLELVAREGDLAPCLGTAVGDFSSFREIFIVENGDVFFHAFLTGAAVGSNNDGTFWRWQASDSTLHPILREGDPAPSTQGAVFTSLLDFAVSDDGRQAVTATLTPGIGDCELGNNYGLWMDDLTDGLPILQMREGDQFDLGLEEDTFLTVLSIEKTTNFVGGSGGHGKVLNGLGEIIAKVSFDVNTSGAIILGGTPPP